jgi:hypothetical protein
MAKRKSVFRQMGDSIKAGATALADVAQAALTSSSDLPSDGGYTPVKKQRWAQEIEATGAKKRAKKKSKKKTAKKPAKKAGKTAPKKSKKKKL